MRGQRKNPRKAVQPFENKKRKIDIFKNYEANGVEKIQRKLEIFSTLISKKSSSTVWFIAGVIERHWSMHFPEPFGECELSAVSRTILEKPQTNLFS